MNRDESAFRLLAAVNLHTSSLGENSDCFANHVADVASVIAENSDLKNHIRQLEEQLTSENKVPLPYVDPQSVAGYFDKEGFLDLFKRAYGWTVFYNGEVAGLVAGDMGFDGCANPLMLGDLVSHAISDSVDASKSSDAIDEALSVLIQKCSEALQAEKTYEVKSNI